jgi:hypothetical protein
MLLKFLYGFRGLIEAASAVSLKLPIRFRGLIETPEAASAVSLRPLKQTISNDYLKFLSDFEVICETALACESGPLRVLIMEELETVQYCFSVWPLGEIMAVVSRKVS